MKREPLGRAEKWCLAATIVCGVPLIVAPIWWQHQNAQAIVSIPDVKLPSPNAYDYDVAAAQKIVWTWQVEHAVLLFRSGRSIPAMPNIAANQPSPNNGPAPMQNHAYSTTEKMWLLEQNAAALQTLRKGFAFSYWQPPTRFSSYSGSLADILSIQADANSNSFYHLTQLLILQARLQQARGDWNGALNTCLDGVRFGTDIPHGASLASATWGWGIENMARCEAWPCISHLSSAQARNALARLQLLQDHRVSFAQTLQQEKWAQQTLMLHIFRDPNWRNIPFSNDNSVRSPWGLRSSFVSQQEVLDDMTRRMDAQSALVRLPYKRLSESPTNSNSLDALLALGSYTTNRVSSAQCETQSALLLTALALQSYKTEHGAYPQTLNALVSQYLKSVPIDPFSDGRPLSYKLKSLRYISDIRQIPTGRQIPSEAPGANAKTPKVPETKPRFEYSNTPYTLYSIGPDAKDNSGRPIENTSATFSARGRYSSFFGAIDDTPIPDGDIVASVNTE